jgi:thymidine kinase
MLLTPEVNTRDGKGWIYSRIGLRAEATPFSSVEDLFQLVSSENAVSQVDCVLLDEAQFLSKKQVTQLCRVADELDIPVLTYGLRTDFRGDLFEGSQFLLAWADALNEIKTICHCGRKATMVLRIGPDGTPVREGLPPASP